MRTEKFKALFKYAPKSNLKASDGAKVGNFAFYTSSSIISKRTNKAQFYDEALVFGNGGSANIHYANQPFGTTSHCFVANPISENLNVKYVYYYLFGNIHLLERGFKGVGLKNISPKYIENLDIPVLPIETQNKIVAILDKASALVSKREQSMEMIDKVLYATFNNIFGDIVINPKGWPTKNLEESVLIMRDGPFGSNLKTEHYTEFGVRIIRLQNIEPNIFNDNNKEYVSEEHSETLKKHICIPGDVLVGTLGDPNLRACKFPTKLFDKAINKADCIQIRPNKNVAINSYLAFLLNHPGALHLVSNYIKGQTRSRISKGKLSKIDIPIPPIKLQKQFELIEAKFEKLREKLLRDDLYNLNQSLVQKVFNGQLNFNVDFELDALIKEIEVSKKDIEEYSAIDNDRTEPKLIENIQVKKKHNQDIISKGVNSSLWETKSVLGRPSSVPFNETEGNAIFKNVFAKKSKGFCFDEFEGFVKEEGFNYNYLQLKEFIFNKLENKEITQFYSNKEWRETNYDKDTSPLQDDFAGDGKIYLVPNKIKK